MSKDIIRMAREAGGYPAATTDRALLLFSESHLERFAALVAAAENEACAKVCDDWPIGRDDVCEIAAFIRTRSDK